MGSLGGCIVARKVLIDELKCGPAQRDESRCCHRAATHEDIGAGVLPVTNLRTTPKHDTCMYGWLLNLWGQTNLASK